MLETVKEMLDHEECSALIEFQTTGLGQQQRRPNTKRSAAT